MQQRHAATRQGHIAYIGCARDASGVFMHDLPCLSQTDEAREFFEALNYAFVVELTAAALADSSVASKTGAV